MARKKPAKKKSRTNSAQRAKRAKPASRQASTGGLSDAKLKKFADNIGSTKADLDKARGEHGQLFKQFEDAGGNKGALKMAMKLKTMEPAKAQQHWRDLMRYLGVLGVWDQWELLDPVPDQPSGNGASEPLDFDDQPQGAPA